MNRILNLYLTLFFTFIVQGCNAIYFYETQKYSLTVEGRPDPTSPVSFNLGVKHRVASVIPEKDNLTDDNGEAVSLISYFNLHKTNDPTGIFDDPILVETVLISGLAAKNLGKNKEGNDTTGEVLNIISTFNRLSGNDFVYINNLIDVLNEDARKGNKKAKEIIAELSAINTELLAGSYPVTTYFIDAGSLPFNLDIRHKSNADIKYAKNIIGLFNFLGELDTSTISIQGILDKPDQYKVLGDPANNQFIIKGLKTSIEKTKEVSKRLGRKLKRDSGYIKATKYYVENHLGLS